MGRLLERSIFLVPSPARRGIGNQNSKGCLILTLIPIRGHDGMYGAGLNPAPYHLTVFSGLSVSLWLTFSFFQFTSPTKINPAHCGVMESDMSGDPPRARSKTLSSCHSRTGYVRRQIGGVFGSAESQTPLQNFSGIQP